jgi:hypothetical protein
MCSAAWPEPAALLRGTAAHDGIADVVDRGLGRRERRRPGLQGLSVVMLLVRPVILI